ncbi:hypothetical protein ALQ30_04921 [Pseudomonas syringae pv. persicae]|uniref:Uncharacterized protein n=1 Tax=Pseudomonas syringae pv. persicae TaxID=237306 RepID=A0A3M3ZL17_9PSED|nr:hypothetical protein ALQ30_04921 [Pseudomonas syringae pv. persicae]RMQ09783.1 hypothetical protein ALQ09_04735 [Pseudomonas viridiflava]
MRNDNLDYRAALCVACRSGRSASYPEHAARRRSVTQSVTHGITTLEREERLSRLSCGAPRRMPFRTLRVLSCTGGAAQICDAERYPRHYHAGA